MVFQHARSAIELNDYLKVRYFRKCIPFYVSSVVSIIVIPTMRALTGENAPDDGGYCRLLSA